MVKHNLINALPPPENFSVFNERVRCLCALFDGSVSGGPRTKSRNRLVGGHVNSRHLWRRGGLSTDVVLDNWDLTDNFISAANVLGIHVYDESRSTEPHLHLQATPPDQPNPGESRVA